MQSTGYFDKAVFITCILIGAYHITAIFSIVDTSPWWRHLLFAGICSFIAYAWYKRFKILPLFISVLFIQQCTTHGVSLVKKWTEQKRVDWISLVILGMLVILFAASVSSRFSKQQK